MPGPLSTDLRERVVAARRSGLSRLATAQLFSVSGSSVQRWCRLDREQGNVAPKPMGGTRLFVLANEHDWLVERIAEQPDVALRTLLAELHERAIEVSYFAVWNIVDRTGLSYKKTLHASEQDRPDVARRRLQWQQRQASVDPQRLIFIDETWSKTNMSASVRTFCQRGASPRPGWSQPSNRRKLRRRKAGWGATGGEPTVRRMTNLFRRGTAASLLIHGEAWNN